MEVVIVILESWFCVRGALRSFIVFWGGFMKGKQKKSVSTLAFADWKNYHQSLGYLDSGLVISKPGDSASDRHFESW